MVPYQTWTPSVSVGVGPYVGPRRYYGVRYGYPRRAYRYQRYDRPRGRVYSDRHPPRTTKSVAPRRMDGPPPQGRN
jgi:hypothetical protein